MNSNVFLIGASTRAAAFSALRAGFRPRCADLFADADLVCRCPTERVSSTDYPRALLAWLRRQPPGPFMYTGGLENHSQLIEQAATTHTLWGIRGSALRRARSPAFVERLLRDAAMPAPAVRASPPTSLDQGRWLIKPLRSAGGAGIRTWSSDQAVAQEGRPVYYQEFIEGEPCAALYVAHEQGARLLGLTRQLVGEPWLHAAPFQYCGSLGPLPLARSEKAVLERLGNTLARGCGLRGLFGVDCIWRAGQPWTVEINPRYTASVEVLEHATGLPAMALHRRAFDCDSPEPLDVSVGPSFVGKAILFARADLRFPGDGPWHADLGPARSCHELPAFADLPHPNEPIAAGRPVLTILARAASLAACRDELQRRAADLDRWLFGT